MSGEPTSVPQIIRASIYFVPTITKHWSECFTCILFIPHPTLYFSHQGSDSKEFAYNAGDLGLVPGSGRSLEEGMATHSRILAWRIPWTEEPRGLQSMGSKKVGHDWVTNTSLQHYTVISVAYYIPFSDETTCGTQEWRKFPKVTWAVNSTTIL